MNSGTVTGQVFDQDGNVISGVTLSIERQTATSLGDGSFLFSKINLPNRLRINASASGYIAAQQVFVSPPMNAFITTDIYLHSIPAPLTLDITAGDIITDGSSTLQVNAGTVMKDSRGNTVTGTVDVTLCTFDPSDDTDLQMFPGIFAGRTSPSSADEPFESFGFLYVSVSKNGQQLNLANGSTAEVVIPIPSALLARAPLNIDLWTYDEAGGYWLHAGTATRSGNYYIAVITHFSWYNWDWSYAGRSGYISGRATYADGTPFTGMYAAAIGVGSSGHGGCWLASDGTFTIPVLCDITKEVTIWGLPYNGIYCNVITTDEPHVTGQTYALTSDIIVTDERRSATTVESIIVSPSSASALLGGLYTFSASARNVYGFPIIGKTFKWWTSNDTVATVDAAGIIIKAYSTGLGSCTIFASCEGKTGTATFSVGGTTTASVEIVPPSASMPTASHRSFTARAKNNVGTVLSGKSFEWWTSDPLVATCDATGTTVEATAMSIGSCHLYSSCEGVLGTAEITVTTASTTVASVSVSPFTQSIPVGGSGFYTATARNSSGDILTGKAFSWFSTNSSVATVELSGTTVEAFGKSSGFCYIYASSGGKSGSAEVQVP